MRVRSGRRMLAVWLVLLTAGACKRGESPPPAVEAPEVVAPSTPTDCAAGPAGCTPQPTAPPPQQEPVTPEPAPPAPPQCQPTAGGPYWLEEGESVRFQVTCATGLVPGEGALRVEPLPAGAQWDPATATFQWTPGLDQAAVYTLSLVGPGGETGTVKVGVADRWHDKANVPVQDPTRYTEEYGLPVLHLQASAPLVKAGYVPATVVYRGHTYAAQAKLRGASSLFFPKNSYTVKFPREDLFQEPEAAGGFTHRRSLVLITTFNDNSYVRPRLAFELWRRLSPQSIQVAAYSAVLFLNGAYHGLYTVADHVDEHLMKRYGLSKDGNLYKAVTGDANFKLTDKDGKRKEVLHQGLEKKEGVPVPPDPDAYADLHELIRFVATASLEEFRAEAPRRIALRGYEDWWILVNMLVARDSDAKNAYHYHDPLGGPWRFTPWDLDGTFGQGWMTERYSPASDLDLGTENAMFGRLLADPTFSVPLKERFLMVLRNEASPAVLHALLDAYVQEVAASARRDQQKWGKAYRGYRVWATRDDFTTFEEEVEYIRRWIELRWDFLDTALQQLP